MSTEAQIEAWQTFPLDSTLEAARAIYEKHAQNGAGLTPDESQRLAGYDDLVQRESWRAALTTLRIEGVLRDSGLKRPGFHGRCLNMTVWTLGDDLVRVLADRRRKLSQTIEERGKRGFMFPTEWLWDEIERREGINA